MFYIIFTGDIFNEKFKSKGFSTIQNCLKITEVCFHTYKKKKNDLDNGEVIF